MTARIEMTLVTLETEDEEEGWVAELYDDADELVIDAAIAKAEGRP